jgi:HK97 family phage major capsid protein
VYRAAETDTVTASRPKFNKHQLDLEDLKGLAYMSDRLLRNVAALESIFGTAFAEEFAWTIDNEILRGNGAAQMLGILNSPALISVSAETGQAASTIVWENIVKMRARVHPRSRQNMVWLINVDCEPQLHLMYFQAGTAAVPVYLPSNGAAGQPDATLYGRPVIPIEQASTLGTVGDITAVDLSQYLVITQGGLRAASSMHVRFIYDEMTFKWNYSINGMPKWKTALTPANGSNTTSPFVALATRS